MKVTYYLDDLTNATAEQVYDSALALGGYDVEIESEEYESEPVPRGTPKPEKHWAQ